MSKVYGKIHSVETMGTRDGPGLRCVFFFAGCGFRCRFCHNPDTFTEKGSSRMSLENAIERLEPLLPYLRGGEGGITASGGEPTLQPDFLRGLFRLAHVLGLSTALDTNGTCEPSKRAGIIKYTDTVLLDIKASTSDLHKWLTGNGIERTLEFGRIIADMHAEKGRPRLVLRRVVLPGINNTAVEIAEFVKYIQSLAKMPPVELIPYHKMGVHKWEELGFHYTLADLEPPTSSCMKKFTGTLEEVGVRII